MFNHASGLTFLNPLPPFVFLLIFFTTLGFLFFSFFRFSVPAPWKLRVFLAFLRTFVLGLVLWILLDPYWNRPNSADWIGVLVDTSKSMGIHDAGIKTSRLEEVQQYFEKDRFWSQLQKNRIRKIMTFDRQLNEASDLLKVPAEGDASKLMTAIREIDNRYREDTHLMGWIVFSDGAATDLSPGGDQFISETSFPWITVGVGIPGEISNVRMEEPEFKEPVFVGDLIPFVIKWTSNLPPKTPAKLTVVLDKKPMIEKNIFLDSGQFPLELNFLEPGDHFLDLQLSGVENEGSLVDNSVRVAIKAHPRLTRVFYAESFYKDRNFFKEALEEDKSFKVSFASSLVGFSRKNRLPFIKDPIYGLPRTRNDFLQYDVIVLSDVKRDLLEPDQIEWIRELVEKEGGALIMIGGVDSFGDGGYVGTAIEQMLPVEISEQHKQQVFLKSRGVNEKPFRPVIPKESTAEPVLKLIPETEKNQLLWNQMPLLGGYNYVGRPKTGATVLLQHPSDTSEFGPRVVMAAQNFGRGKVLAFTSDVTPNWGQWFQEWKDEKEGWLYARFWRNALKWLSQNRLRGRVSLIELDRTPAIAESFLPLEWKARISGQDVTQGDTSFKFEILKDEKSVQLETFNDFNSNQISWNIPQLDPGDYQLKASYEIKGEVPIATETPFVVHPSRIEASHLPADHEFLKAIAKQTQGVFVPFNRMEALNEALDEIRKVQLHRRSTPLWSHYGLFLLILGILCLDWFIRKKRGLE